MILADSRLKQATDATSVRRVCKQTPSYFRRGWSRIKLRDWPYFTAHTNATARRQQVNTQVQETARMCRLGWLLLHNSH